MSEILAHPTAARAHPPETRPHPVAPRRRTDSELVALLRAGNPHAFDAIHARYHAQLLAFARGVLGGHHHDAEEVVQDAFVKAHAALRASTDEMALRAWLYTIVRNRALDRLRRPSRLVATRVEELHVPDHGADPQTVALRREALRSLLGELRGLPERQRLALVMHEIEDRSHSQIGRALNVSAGGSKALVFRARAALAQTREAA